MRRFIVAFCLVFFISCDKKEINYKVETVKVSRTLLMEIKIPISWHISSTTHWDMGYVQSVKNLEDENVMIIHSAGQPFHNRAYDKKALTEDLTINNDVDTLEERDGKIYKEKIVVLLGAERVNDILRPFFVETICFLDYIDSLACGEIISSFKILR